MRTAFSFGNDDLKFTKKKILEEYNAFFKILKPYHLVDNYFICHSGIPTDFLHHKPTQIPVNKFLFNRYDFISNQKLYLNTYKVIFGHTGFYSPYVDNFKIGIDTSACFLEEQPLTAFCIEERIFINSNNYITELSTISVDYCPNIPRIKPWRT